MRNLGFIDKKLVVNPAYPPPTAAPARPPVTAAAGFASPARGASPHRFATALLLIYLFLLMSRAVETLPALVDVNLHLTLVLMVVLAVVALLNGALLKAVRRPVVLMFIALTGWLMLSTTTSQWRGGSVRTLTGVWISSLACAVLVPGLISSVDQCRKACYVLGFCLLPILLATVIFQQQIAGRESTFFGTLGNPNDLAFSLLLLIPFAAFVIQSESWTNWKTIVCALAIASALVKTLRTGSRSGVVTLAACYVILFFIGRMNARLKLLAAAGAIAVIAFLFVPSSVLLRYATVFNGTSADAAMSADEVSAVESTRARKMLLQESLHLIFEHPLFGVGPGIFSAAMSSEQEKRGERQMWHEAHNSFTQMGSEAGLPAMFLYLGIVFYSLQRSISIYRRTKKDPNRIMICRMAGMLAMSLIIYVICAAFGNYSYTYHLPVLAGLVQALDMCVWEGMTAAPAAVPAPLPVHSVIPTLKPQVPNYVRNRRLRDRRV